MTGRKTNELAVLLARQFIYFRRELSEFASELSNRWHVELKCSFCTSASALMDWGLGYNIRCIVFHSSFGLLGDKAFLKNARLMILIYVNILFRTLRIFFPYALCAKCLSSFRSLCSFLISSSFNLGAGGRVIFVLRRGTYLSRQDLKRELNISSFSFGSSTPKTVLKGTPPRSSLNFASSKCFSLRNNL